MKMKIKEQKSNKMINNKKITKNLLKKLNKKKYFEQLVQYFENMRDCEDFKKLYYDLFGNKENGEK